MPDRASAPTAIDEAAVAALADQVVEPWWKGAPVDAPVALGEIGGRGYRVEDLSLPALLLRDSALENNIATMQRWCDQRDVLLAPHAKTSLAPQLVERQVGAGAWAVTAATPAQLRLWRGLGVERVLYANELVEPRVLGWVAEELARDEAFELYVLADSIEGVHRMDGALTGAPRPVDVLVEIGHEDGRAGCRTLAEAISVASAVRTSAHLRLGGVEAFEGLMRDPAGVDRLLERVREAVGAIGDVSLVSAGGSAWFDRVVGGLGRIGPRLVLRSGCYVTHDAGLYARASPLAGSLENAIEVWASVLSRPEPQLVIAGAGRRDVSFDSGLPVLVAPCPGEVVALSDQHAHIRVDAGAAVAPGDLACLHVSHPCTTLDKWRLGYLVDDEGQVTGAVLTFF